MTPRLVVFTKAPVLGGAKTRLAAGIGKVHANRLYRAMIRAVIRRTRDPRWETQLWVAPDAAASAKFGGVWPDDLRRILQGSGSLSPRLTRAMAAKGPVIVIGTDAPQIRARDIAQALRLLRHNDLVFGPCDDGGFWLIAANGPVDSALFENIAWSTDTALADVQRNCVGRVAYLRTLIDVDDIEALRQVRQS
ncbi:TIGR04282 family arsenosugar biosynthesis glycosyltransferase [Robiginitomaculum antarcticum]|uniref:TIGR04282 family arsenosugar biosynthesis glycosyltransferase n=1 Tax=Robiginitomaculum antarcticum TaxID=437507 RepID=UPI00036F66D9|nr:TIGR04282 family arsenosugar biosynthesis glycosyltransferase [Robiginitomaculum antarcticum]